MNCGSGGQQVPPQSNIVSAAEFSAKFSSKAEVYRFLACDVGCYLPSYEDITIWHLKDLAAGKRKIIKASNVKTIHIPQFEGLTVKDMLTNAKNFPIVMQALPIEPREINKLPRQYLANLIYTMVGDPFRNWIEKKIQERNEKIMKEKNLAIEMDPDVLKAFRTSHYVSSKQSLQSLQSLFVQFKLVQAHI